VPRDVPSTRELRPSSRLQRAAVALAVVVALGAVAFWALTRPDPVDAADLPDHEPNLAAGETLFYAGSCLACHQPGEGVSVARDDLPAGGAPFPTPVGTFYPQNLTPDAETGIGRWSREDFVSAMVRGVSPNGTHYFPAFPYPSYRRMRTEDVLDLYGFLMSLPPVHSPRREPEVPMAALARRAVGLWKLLALTDATATPDPGSGDSRSRGAYLVNSAGHCGECHTPRNALMVVDESRNLAGGPHPRGEGNVPSLRGLVERERCKDAADLTLAMQFGETFGYDKLSSGGMGAIQANLARLPESDVRAIADYLVSLE